MNTLIKVFKDLENDSDNELYVEEWSSAAKRLGCDKDSLVRLEDFIESGIYPDNEEGYDRLDDLIDDIYSGDLTTIEDLSYQPGYELCLVELNGYRYIQGCDMGCYFQYWNKEDLQKFLSEKKEYLYSKHDRELVDYWYSLFSDIN